MKKLLLFVLVVINLFALTSKEKEALEYMYQEEKLAKDVYYVLGNMYPDLRVFHNIYKSETIHERSVANVLQHYNIPLPIRSDEIGQFENSELQNLYNELIAKGEKSKVDALEVGIMVEVTDVEDLDRYLEEATSPDVIALFKFLRAGSYNHYNAFNKNLIQLTGKGACELMDSKWCKDYPFQRGIGREYRDYYWFDRGVEECKGHNGHKHHKYGGWRFKNY